MVTPGLLPEAFDRRRPGALRAVVVLALLSLCALLAFLVVRLAQVSRERDRLLAEALQSRPARPQPAPPAPAPEPSAAAAEVASLRSRIAELEAERRKPEPPPEPARAIRLLPKTESAERLTQGLHELRSGRPVEAELCLLRALPEGFLPLVMTALLRGDVREAVVFLAHAIASDPDWLRRFRPRDLFGTPGEYEKARRAVEDRVQEDALDPDAKVLLAYFLYHEKGPAYAKALLVEATALRPGHPETARFLEAVDRP